LRQTPRFCRISVLLGAVAQLEIRIDTAKRGDRPEAGKSHRGDVNAHGITNIETSSQAAEALRPIAGDFAYLIFALGFIGTVLARSAAYAIGEAWRALREAWRALTRQPREAVTFYATLVDRI
jgi:hypothetical protein